MALSHNPQVKNKDQCQIQTYTLKINVTLEIFNEIKKPMAQYHHANRCFVIHTEQLCDSNLCCNT
jgi:hypothetical protein